MSENVLWQDLYGAAMLELDPSRLRHRIEAARAAIQRHRDDLAHSDQNGSVDELLQIADALENLRLLQKLEFRAPTGTADDDGAEGAVL